MATPMNELPANVQVKEETRTLLRRASQELHDANPYVEMSTDGIVYLPPEAAMKYAEDAKKPTATEDSDDEVELKKHDKEKPQEEGGADVAWEGTFAFLSETAYSQPWHAKIWSDDFQSTKHCLPNGKLKQRRGVPQIRASDLLSGLVQKDGCYFFPEPLNGWPAMQGFMLMSITKATAGWGGLSTSIQRLWTAKEGKAGKALPEAAAMAKGCRATFWAPTWSTIGWSMNSPGYVFWYSEQYNDGKARLLHGNAMNDTLRGDWNRNSNITRIHAYAHRYPSKKESTLDKLTYHTLVLAEWDHRQFTTVIELAFLNAVGGYGGKANWNEDKLAPTTKIFALMNETPAFIQPWNESMSEVRMYDMAAKDAAEFEAYLNKYNEKSGLPLGEQRFLEWERYATAKPKMRVTNSETMVNYMCNYIQRVWGYRQTSLNCQTFAADLFSFLTGDRNHTVFSNIIKPGYSQHMLSFLYEPQSGKEYTEEPKKKPDDAFPVG